MPRVLLTGFCAVPGPRRAGVQLRHVIRALTPMHSVDLLVAREGEQAYVERQGSVRVLRVPTHEADPRSQIHAFQRALKRQLDGADYDVVHCRDSWSGIPVLEARARLGYAVVYDLTRSPLGETTLDAELDAQYGRDEEACLLAADLVLAPTPAAVKALQGRGRPERVLLSPPGVDVDRFDWEHGPKSDVPRIVYAGSIDPGRGVRVLVRAMASVIKEVDARLVLAGAYAPKFEQALRDGVRELGIADKVELLGPVDHDQLPALLATATVCVVPAAADLTPNPTVVYPTKLLEYMACRTAIIAPRRETVAQVVENLREALLFEPGDPIDLARKILRLIGEPRLRERIAQLAYERVRRDFTASAARRGLRAAYDVLAERFAMRADEAEEEAPRVELLSDDEFEATVFEEAPGQVAGSRSIDVDTALNKVEMPEDALPEDALPEDALDDGTGSTSSEHLIAPPRPPSAGEPDETMERAPVAPGPRDSGTWTVGVLAMPPLPPGQDDWVVGRVGDATRSLEAEAEAAQADTGVHAAQPDDGTPIEGVTPAAPALPAMDGSFVAGEIDVPTPPPDLRGEGRARDTPQVEFTAVSGLLGTDTPEPDTGSRTPALERIPPPPGR